MHLNGGSNGSGDGQFILPHGIDFDSTGNVYITDRIKNDIQKFTPNGTFITKWGDEGEFDHPHGIGVDSSGNVFVNEYFPRIQKFDNDGNFIKQWDSVRGGNGEFDSGLEHLFVDAEDNISQVDGPGNPRIQKFDNDGNYVTHVGSGPCIIPDSVKNNPKQMASHNICDGKLHEPEQAGMNSKGDLM